MQAVQPFIQTLLLQAMALYIHGPLRCKDLLGRIPNPHSRPALAAPQHTPTQPRSDTQQPTLEAVQHPQPHTIRPPDSTKARPTIKPDRLFLLHDGTGHRPAETIGKNHTARPPPALPAASIFRRGDQPQIRQGENHQHDHSPAPNKSGPALEADRRPRREQQPPRTRSDRPRTSRQTGTRCTRPCDGKAPGGHHPARAAATPRPPANSPSLNRPAHPAGHQKQGTV